MSKRLMMIGLLLVAVLTGCSHDESTETVDRKQTSVSAEFVSADEAKAIASAIHFEPTDGKTATTRSGAALDKEVQSVTPVSDASGATAFYVINYRGGGFMLLSADKRVNPVLAFSETSTFPMNDPKGFPGGLASWMDDTKEHVQEVRAKNEPLTEAMVAAWEPSRIQAMFARPHNPSVSMISDNSHLGRNKTNDCDPIGPLLKTLWNGEEGFNDFAPMMGCSEYINGKAAAGCVAVAMAQIMKYHQHPKGYNWNAMPDSIPSVETAKLMRDIGDAVHMEYGCNGSSAYYRNISIAFYRFQYASAKRGSYDPDVVKRELKARRPVLLDGGRKDANGKYTDGHSWVCDGYQKIILGNDSDRVIEILHMNWGWFYNDFNGWFYLYDWNPGYYTFNYGQSMIYEIIP